VDGLMCVFDTVGDINDDEGMDSVRVNFHNYSAISIYVFLSRPLYLICVIYIICLNFLVHPFGCSRIVQ
jgi:hypothetical protein